MYALVEDWLSSGESQRSFCRQRGCSHSTLRYWHSKYLEDREPVGSFAELHVSPSSSLPAGMTLRYANGVELRLPGSVSVAELQTLIELGA